MSADADDLLERAQQALERNIPTVAEVTAELAAALDGLERDFPDGRPGREDALRRLEYMNLVGRVKNCQWQLANGQCVEFPRGRESQLDQTDGEWETFLEAHPELAEGEHNDAS